MINNLKSLQSVEPIEFERITSDLLERMGFDVTRTKSSGDGGVDVIAINEQPIIGGKYIVQCKRYATGNNIGEPTIRDLYGAMHAEKANKGILITTSEFSRHARAFAADKQIELIDGNTLLGLLSEYFITDEIEDSLIEKESTPSSSMLSGFKGIAWGSSTHETDDINFIEHWTDEDDKSACRRVNDSNNIYGAITEDATYYFYKDRFFLVSIPFKNWKNYDLILNNIKASYGNPNYLGSGGPLFIWRVKDIEVYLNFLDDCDEGTLSITYIPISDEYTEKTQMNIKAEKNQQCFIATAIYESPYSVEVVALKKWRDSCLNSNWFGKLFIYLYYIVGPFIAHYISDKKRVKNKIKKLLDLFVRSLLND